MGENINVSDLLRQRNVNNLVRSGSDDPAEEITDMLSLEDFDAETMHLKTIPKNASQTVQGSKVVQPLAP